MDRNLWRCRQRGPQIDPAVDRPAGEVHGPADRDLACCTAQAPGIKHETMVQEPYVALLAAELESCIELALANQQRERMAEATSA